MNKFLAFHQKKQEQSSNFNSRYRIISEAGKGAFGSVFKAEDTHIQSLSPFTPKYVAIKKLFYDRRYEQRELSILDEIKRNKKCANIIELKDRYFQHLEELDVTNKKHDKMELVRKEFLFIVTDFLPYTICDLQVTQSASNPASHCLESIR